MPVTGRGSAGLYTAVAGLGLERRAVSLSGRLVAPLSAQLGGRPARRSVHAPGPGEWHHRPRHGGSPAADSRQGTTAARRRQAAAVARRAWKWRVGPRGPTVQTRDRAARAADFSADERRLDRRRVDWGHRC